MNKDDINFLTEAFVKVTPILEVGGGHLPTGHIGALAQQGVEELEQPEDIKEHEASYLRVSNALSELQGLLKTINKTHFNAVDSDQEDKYLDTLNTLVNEENVRQLIKQLDAVYNRMTNAFSK